MSGQKNLVPRCQKKNKYFWQLIAAQKKYLIVIAGATAVGKTTLAIDLAKHYNAVILSADSRQFYKELSIGTAKPSDEQLREVQHYFINNKTISELYGAGHFEKDAIALLDELFKTHHLVFMAGGSGLYIDAVLNGVDDFAEVPNGVRENLNKQFEEKGLAWLQNEVKKTDEVYFNSVDINNPQRLIRALEVSVHTGLPYSSYLKKNKTQRNFIPIKILINTNREKLYAQINQRVNDMIKNGLLQEAEQFKAHRNVNALKTVGYKELYDYFDGKYDLETAVEKIKQHTRNYAKRQITWFKNKDSFTEFEPNEKEKIIRYIDETVNFEH